ncbi:hypothetical protein N2152v2_004757 [Parachlorella kessleri]
MASEEREGGGRRKRESLFDNGEPGVLGQGNSPDGNSGNSYSSTNKSSSRARPGSRYEQQQQQQQAAERPWDAPAFYNPATEGVQQAAGAGRSREELSKSTAPLGVWDEWGPVTADPGLKEEDLGWAAESWAGGRPSPTAAAQQHQEDGAYDAHQQQRLQPGSEGPEPAAQHHAYGGSRWDVHSPHQQQGASSGSASCAGGTQPNGRPGQWQEEPQQYASQFEPGDLPPDIAMLSPTEMDRVLPVVPFSNQAAYFSRGAVSSVQRWGASLAVTVLLSKVALLAATSLTFPLWYPWALAYNKNFSLRKQYKFAGLWRTQILEMEITGRPRPAFGEQVERGQLFTNMRMARFLVGDPGGARTEMLLPYDSRFEGLREGDAAELIVLSNSPGFEKFKAVKDVYLPGPCLWLSEYPFTERAAFLEVSLEIENEAEREAEEASSREAAVQQAPAQQSGYYPSY